MKKHATVSIHKKIVEDFASIPRRENGQLPGISVKARLFSVVCIRSDTQTVSSGNWFEPLHIYAAIEDFDLNSDDDYKFWVYASEKNLETGLWYEEEKFHEHFRIISA